jgi:hypothetical protein
LLDDELRGRIERVRAALAALPDGALIGYVPPPQPVLPADLARIEQLAEFLCVADGVHCDEFILYGVEDLNEELARPGPYDWLPGGTARWLMVGRNHVFPVVLDRQTQEVVELNDDGPHEVIRQLGPFRRLVRDLFGGEYLTLSYGLGETWAALVRGTAAVARESDQAEPGAAPNGTSLSRDSAS